MEKPLHPYLVNNYVNAALRSLTRFTSSFLCLPILFFLICASQVKSQSLPSGFSQVLVANGISNPTVMAFAPDGRIFVAQQDGQLRVIKNGGLLSQPFISLSVHSSGERGLLGIAFDPNFSSNGYIYLYYTLSSGSNNRISRFTANGDVAASGSERVILDLDPLSSATNHNGGTMQFGPDGKLYVGVGENVNAVYAQRTDTYHGKLLRINSDGSVPSGNPFTSGNDQQLRIWAYGLRNPYTIAFQPGTGRLFVNDVGASAWEEINDATTGGKNFGWPNQEGYGDGFSSPIYAYGHGEGIGSGCAITGGTFFNPSSTNYPSIYQGRYFFMDFCNNWIDMITVSGGSASRSNFASNIAGSALSITTGTDGNLYFLSRDNGAVYKITYAGGSSAPVITNQPQSITVAEGNSATFTVSATSTAPLTYQWRKNGTNISGATNSSYTISSAAASHAGTYSVVVSNTSGSITSNNATLTVTLPNQPPTASITTPVQGASYAGGNVINFSGTATDPENGNLSSGAYTWYVVFYHDTHSHPGPSVTANGPSGSFTIPNTGETAANVFYRLYLVVTDQQGARDTTYRDITPRTSTITLNTNPQGLNITLDGQPFTAPVTVTSVEGILRTIGTASPQTFNGSGYNFNNWSHGGTQTQTLSTPVTNVIYTANFSAAATAPVITSQPQGITVTQGNNATFNVTANGTAPLSYQWRKNGTNISGATSSSYTILSVTAASAGTYSVVVSNSAGNVTSSNAILTVTSVPAITSQPQSITVTQGNNATFNVTATGTAPLNYQWRKNGTNISGATNSSYTILSVTAASAGAYSVVVSNNAGNVTSSNAILTVTSVPVITSQPQSITVTQGDAATFRVTAAGTAPLSYQWRKNGTNISGATSSTYTISSVTAASAGTYSVVVSNSAGTVTSSNAILTVTSVPVITSQPQSVTVTQGDAATFHVTAAGTAPLSYQWRKNGTNISAATGSSYTIAAVTTPHEGNYSVVVSNEAGSTTSNNALLTVTDITQPPPPGGDLRDPDNPSNTTNGLAYSFYHGTWSELPDFATLRKENAGYVLNFDLSPRDEHDNFGFHFRGYIFVPADGIYTFYTASDAGSKLYIGSEVVVDNNGLHSMQEKSGEIGLKAGKHEITVDYFEKSMQQGLAVSYAGPGIEKQLIPDSVLFRNLPELLTLNPVADNYVRSGRFNNVNPGPAPTLNIGNAEDNYETFLRFDISSVREGLSSAKLRLYGGLNGSGVSSVVAEVFDVGSQGWMEQTITFDNKPSSQTRALVAATINVAPDQYYEWDLTEHIINLRSSGALYVSLRIKSLNNTNNSLLFFNSKENTENKPELSIEYAPLIVQARSGNAASTGNEITKGAVNTATAGTASFSIYPNPVTNSFTLRYTAEFKNQQLQITDLNGKLLKQVLLTGEGTQHIRVDDFKEGMYLLSIEANKKRYAQKILISK